MYTLNHSLLSYVLLHVFSPTVACLTYHSLDIFFCGAEVLILMKSGLSIISSMSCVFFLFSPEGNTQGY